jgi:predicted dehydrogenase/aryl-alcohol dehydrogenase-like predicted oxidoreductase
MVGPDSLGSENGKLAWGILGTGGIARTFARALTTSDTGYLLAVGSRTAESAQGFGAELGVSRCYGGYDALLADPDVQAVYISLPNHLHALWTIKCAEAGKHVLCEKPLAANYGEAMTAVEAARYHGVFLMEAFMYRCHPQTARLAELIREKAIGEVRVIQAHFSFNMHGPHPENIRQQNATAGGGIMDVGCYCASMARLVAGAAMGQPFADPLQVRGCGHLDPTSGVDEWATAVCKFPGEIVANLTTGIQVGVDPTLRVWGSTGHLLVPNPWFPGPQDGEITVYHDGQKEPERILVRADAPLYSIEADTVAQHLAARQAPSPCMTWADSLGNMATIDQWRQEIGLTFANETPEALTVPVSGRPLRRRHDATMQYGHVAGIDKPISRIVMGTMVYARDRLSFACAMLDHYFEEGGNCLDTAWVYGTEATVGRWLRLRGLREETVLIGKGAHTPECTPEGLTRQLYQTLDRLRTDYLDLYMMHRDDPGVPVGEFVECLSEHQRAGRIRAFGGSNWTIERLEAANAYARSHGLTAFAASSPNLALAVWNEPMWAGCVAASDPASRSWYERTQMPLFAWSSQASGLFTGRFQPQDRDNPAHASVARTWFNEDNWRRLGRVGELAARRGATAVQIALAYVLCQPLNVFALIGPRSIEETRTSLQALGVSLTSDELHWLNLEA